MGMVTPGWLSISQKPGKKLPTRSIIKNHLKEWNMDKDKKKKFIETEDFDIKTHKKQESQEAKEMYEHFGATE